jgi:ribosomal protein L37AE/L43A
MTFFGSRLRRAESKMRDSVRCPECGLSPQQRGYIVVDGKDPVPDLPEVCPECGRSTRLRIVVVEEGGEGEGA